MSKDGEGKREIEVSPRAYKATTIFTTITSVILIFVGFYLIDQGTLKYKGSGDLNPVFVIPGIALMLFAAGLYVFSTRFKTKQEMEYTEGKKSLDEGENDEEDLVKESDGEDEEPVEQNRNEKEIEEEDKSDKKGGDRNGG